MKAAAGILGIFIVMPIWFYLLHSILTAIGANELEWFLYWAYVPVSLIVQTAAKFAEKD